MLEGSKMTLLGLERILENGKWVGRVFIEFESLFYWKMTLKRGNKFEIEVKSFTRN
jgi:hypothetical protein